VSRAGRRFFLRIFLAVAALAALVWVAMDQFDIPAAEMQTLFISTLLAVGLVIVAAALCAGLWIALRRLLGGERDEF
jgi:drug/metabolite transporter (DMT)-like permease